MSSDLARTYTDKAKEVIDRYITHREGAETWWRNETKHRRTYGLTPEHEQELIEILKQKFPKGKSNG